MIDDEDDCVIRKKILRHFGKAWESDKRVFALYINEIPMGAPPKEWHEEAFTKIEQLVADGMSINAACAKIADEIASRENIEPKTVEMAYRRYQREIPRERFRHCVAMRDMDGAVEAYRRMTKPTKRKLGLE
jgi:uncharacterized protein YoaH (UPF0181 family)